MGPSVARIAVNGIEVGTLSADMYESIVKEVRATKRLYIAQAINWLRAFLRFSVTTVLHTCAIMLIIAMALIVFAPSLTADVWESIQKATPDEFATSLRLVVLLTWMCSVLCGFVLTLFYPQHYGALNVFDVAINRRIREVLEVPTDGTMTVTVSRAVGSA